MFVDRQNGCPQSINSTIRGLLRGTVAPQASEIGYSRFRYRQGVIAREKRVRVLSADRLRQRPFRRRCQLGQPIDGYSHQAMSKAKQQERSEIIALLAERFPKCF
jgi:hypothetical protein